MIEQSNLRSLFQVTDAEELPFSQKKILSWFASYLTYFIEGLHFKEVTTVRRNLTPTLNIRHTLQLLFGRSYTINK